MLVKEGMDVTKDVQVTDAILDRFYDYAIKNVKKIDRDELVKDADYIRDSISVELVSEKLGDKEAREYAVLHDPQVAVAEQIIKNGGKISAQLAAKYPKIKDTTIAGEKKLEEERAQHSSDDDQ
jgi:hypothetical protein